VFEPLLAGRGARYAAWDWDARRPGDERTVEPQGLVVVEGVCALHRMFRDAYDVRVWVDAPYETRLARGVARDGEAARATWVERWMPMEDRYVERDDPVACADLVVDGAG
jgi:uridine kinase